MKALAVSFLLLLTGCQNSLMRDLVAKLTGGEAAQRERTVPGEEGLGLSDEKRDEIRDRYKDQVEATRDKKERDASAEEEANREEAQ